MPRSRRGLKTIYYIIINMLQWIDRIDVSALRINALHQTLLMFLIHLNTNVNTLSSFYINPFLFVFLCLLLYNYL